jgi:hypothetical protein
LDAEIIEALPSELQGNYDNFARWRIAYAWQALTTYGIVRPGASGFLAMSAAANFRAALERRGVLAADLAGGHARGKHDFFVDMLSMDDAQNGAEFGQTAVRRMSSLRKGGLGVFLFNAKLGGKATVDPTPASETGWIPGEQDIQRVALRIIGHGSDIAQIIWNLERDSNDVTPFGLIARR